MKPWPLVVLAVALLPIVASAAQEEPPPPAEAPPAPPAPPASSARPWETKDAEPLDDPNVPVSGAIAPDLDIIYRDPPNWLGIPPDRELLNGIRDPLKKLDENYGLALTGAYTMLFQQTAGPNANSGAAGDLDLFARWTLLGRGTPDTGAFYVAGEYRHGIGPTTPAQLGGEIGSLLGTTNGFNDRGWALKDAYWVQRLFKDHLRFGVGRVDPDNLVGTYKLQSANTSFLNKAFSTNPAIAIPGSGAGAAISVRPTDWFYVSAAVFNAYGTTTTMDIDELFDEWRVLSYAEIGYVPQIEGLGEGRYRLCLWHMDSRELTGQPSDGGVSFIVDQEIGDTVQAFFRYGYSDAALTNVRNLVEGGAGWTGLVGSPSDLTGLALAWAQPFTDTRNQVTLEAFHRMQLTGRTQLTVGAQLIVDPSNAPGVDALGVFSVRLRITW